MHRLIGVSFLSLAFAIGSSAQAAVVTPGNLQGWTTSASNTSSVTFEPGPATPPLGSGSVQLAVGTDGSGAAQLRTSSMDGQLVSSLTTLSYSSYTDQDGSGGQAPYIMLQVDYTNDGITDDFLFFEPVYQSAVFCPSNPQGPVAVDTWQTWNALAGCWWSSSGTAGSGPGVNTVSLGAILAAQPNARIVASGSGAGGIRFVAGFAAGAFDNYIGNVDNVTIGSTAPATTYDFEFEPTITIGDVTQVEGNAGTTNFVFTLTLSSAVSQQVSVQYATADGTATTADGDYIAATGTATFASNTTATTVTIQAAGDTKLEPDETLFINLTSPVGGSIVDAQGLGTITNDDPQPTITIADVTLAEGNGGTTNFNFTVALSNPSSSTITVNAATADGTASSAADYTAVNTVVTFTPGTVAQTVTVAVTGDATFEPDETFFVNLSGATNATIVDNQGLGTITNDDRVADLAITKTDGVATAAPGGTVTYTITASNAGPSSATGATVVDTFPASLTATWTCVGAGGGACAASGSGNISDTVNLPAGGTVTYTVNATISAAAMGTLANTATVAAPAGVTDPNPGNNSATDTDTLALVTFSGPSATGTGTITASFTAAGGCTFTGPRFIGPPPGAPPVPSTVPPDNPTFPHGLFDFSVTGCASGQSLVFTITYPQPLPPGTRYYKYGPTAGNATPHWYVLPAAIAGNTATFTIVDGGLGDDDLSSNGTIVDQGGPGAGGPPAAVPTLDLRGLVVLILLMGVAAAAMIRRRG